MAILSQSMAIGLKEPPKKKSMAGNQNEKLLNGLGKKSSQIQCFTMKSKNPIY